MEFMTEEEVKAAPESPPEDVGIENEAIGAIDFTIHHKKEPLNKRHCC